MSFFAENEAAAEIYRAAQTKAPATAAELGLMQGFPASAEARVTWASWIRAPYNRWGFQHVGQLLPTLTVHGGGTATSPLAAAALSLDSFEFGSLSGAKQTMGDHLIATYTDACLVLQGGKIRYERYWNGQTPATRHIMFSCTKSVIGLVAEVLVDRGILDENAATAHYLPELINSAFGDATIRQVLDMAVGIDYVEKYDDPDSSSSHYGYASGLLPAPSGLGRYASLYEYLPSLQKRDSHGGLFHYVTAVTEVLGWAMERASGKSSDKLVEEMLWSKIGVERDAYFAADPWGRAITGAGFNATLRDLARFGRLVLQEGRIEGAEILPAKAIRKIAAGGDAAAFARDAEFAAWAPGASYRSQWYVFNDGSPSIMACGIHGQYIFIDFAADLVVVKQSSLPAAESPIGADTVRLLRALAQHFRGQR
ncbi:serine hydrolase domain-containing protein [Dongia rigui]|uniref:Serine hydrolase n=1 Tax=Dongia rigui TaxID=940149 RepID=A0ABU5DVL9_9PROT|nr:serine hydrolase [Dongia rigui]MDY0871345.1 serine hydrolase [Dongia rigui]